MGGTRRSRQTKKVAANKNIFGEQSRSHQPFTPGIYQRPRNPSLGLLQSYGEFRPPPQPQRRRSLASTLQQPRLARCRRTEDDDQRRVGLLFAVAGLTEETIFLVSRAYASTSYWLKGIRVIYDHDIDCLYLGREARRRVFLGQAPRVGVIRPRVEWERV
jgi:hypothetical protein